MEYAKNSVTISVEPFNVMVFLVCCCAADMVECHSIVIEQSLELKDYAVLPLILQVLGYSHLGQLLSLAAAADIRHALPATMQWQATDVFGSARRAGHAAAGAARAHVNRHTESQ